ncbi:hypothetical protein EDB87DRAFT_1767466 [Lactarius vividus]|nr:hypothetical protein EDB87DRAFT_1767466 [Lactarius vividus]
MRVRSLSTSPTRNAGFARLYHHPPHCLTQIRVLAYMLVSPLNEVQVQLRTPMRRSLCRIPLFILDCWPGTTGSATCAASRNLWTEIMMMSLNNLPFLLVYNSLFTGVNDEFPVPRVSRFDVMEWPEVTMLSGKHLLGDVFSTVILLSVPDAIAMVLSDPTIFDFDRLLKLDSVLAAQALGSIACSTSWPSPSAGSETVLWWDARIGLKRAQGYAILNVNSSSILSEARHLILPAFLPSSWNGPIVLTLQDA